MTASLVMLGGTVLWLIGNAWLLRRWLRADGPAELNEIADKLILWNAAVSLVVMASLLLSEAP